MATLLDLARNKLQQLSPDEIDALRCLEIGEEFVQRVNLKSPICAPNYSIIRADLIRWLCSDPQAMEKLTLHGIRFQGVEVEGELKLGALNIPFNISLRSCCLPCPIDLRYSSVASLDLSHSRTASIEADGLIVSGTMRMDEGFRAEGPVSLKAATIKGDLLCTGGNFDSQFGSDNVASAPRNGCEDCKSSILHPYSLVLARAKIEGSLYLCGGLTAKGGVNLSDATIGVNVNCTSSKFTASSLGVNPDQMETVHRLACDAGADHLTCALNFEGMNVKGNLLMGKVAVHGETRFTGAVVDKDLDSAEGTYLNPGACAIHGDRLRVRGSAFFCEGFKAEGGIRLPRAEIGADLSFFRGRLSESKEQALYCEGIRVQGTVNLEKLVAKDGYLDLSYSTIGGNLECTDSKLHGVNGWALKAMGSDIRGSAFLNSSDEGKFEAFGLVALTGGKIGQDLICTDGNFESHVRIQYEEETPCALKADNMIICGKVELSGKRFKATGVNLNDTNIDSFLSCEDGTFIAPAEDGNFNCAISAGKLQVSGSINFRKLVARGEIMLNEVSTGRNLVCRNADLTSEGTKSDLTLLAKQLKVAGSVHMEEMVSRGEVQLELATIAGHFHCGAARFINHCAERHALHAYGITVGGSVEFKAKFHADGVVSIKNANIGKDFVWKDIEEPEKATLILNSTKVGTLKDETKSWPSELQIDGFEYDFLEDTTREGLKCRKMWLQIPPGPLSYFRPQPFEQLAKVLRRIGYEEQAKSILVEKNRVQTKVPIRWPRRNDEKKYPLTQKPFTKLLRLTFGFFVDYGYRPSKALRLGLFFILVGWCVFYLGFENRLMVPTKEAGKNIYQIAVLEKPPLSTLRNSGPYSLVYSLDTFLPVVNLQTKDYWLPTAYPDQPCESCWGVGLCMYRWFHILSGWIISGFYIAALSGLVRK